MGNSSTSVFDFSGGDPETTVNDPSDASAPIEFFEYISSSITSRDRKGRIAIFATQRREDPSQRRDRRPFSMSTWDEGGGQSVRGEHRSAGSSVEDPGAGAVAVRRAQDTEGVQLRGQEAGRPVRVQQMRKIVHEEGLVAETRALGVREGATVSMPILPATVQAESPLAPTHTPPTFGQNRGHGGIPARVHAQARDRLKK